MPAVVDAYKTARSLKYVPVVGADNNGFIGELIDLKDAGLVGAAVTNPPSVGGAGLGSALDVLPEERQSACHSRSPRKSGTARHRGMAWLKS